MKIGNLELGDFPLLLAPMEDVSDPPFRSVCKINGADLMFTEFISSEGLIRDAEKSVQKLDIYDSERPIGIQIFGDKIESMKQAARIAEAAKVIENVQRDVNIALMNELAMIFNKLNLDTQEVLKAAGTKWNFLQFKPGLVGGHCIGVDPYYLLHKSEESGYKPNLLYSSRKINNSVPSFIVEKTIKLMLEADKKIKDANILIFGYTF